VLAAGYMTDFAYVALAMAAPWLGLAWYGGRRNLLWFAAFALAADLQRQHGVGLVGMLVLLALPWGSE